MVLCHILDSDSEGATEPSMAKDNWDQLKAGVSKNMHCVMVMIMVVVVVMRTSDDDEGVWGADCRT